MKDSRDFAVTTLSSRWFQSMTVLIKNECFLHSCFACGAIKPLLLFIATVSTKFLVSQPVKVLALIFLLPLAGKFNG